MTEPLRAVACGKSGCPVLTDGRCLEGFDEPCEDCPNVRCAATAAGSAELPPDGDAGRHSETDVPDDQPLGEALPLGETLSTAGADALLARRPARVVCLVGDNDAGKTTLLATLFESFQAGRFAGFAFAGSSTLVGFERRCHAARVESGRKTADTPRTEQAEGLRFFHLRLSDGRREKVDLLLADRAGEGYKAIRNTNMALQGLDELGRADVVLFLIDGERLLDPADRMSVRYDVFTTVKVVMDSRVLRPGTVLLLTLTKVDLLNEAPEGIDAEAAFSDLHRDLVAVSGAMFVRSLRIASRPSDPKLPQAMGLDELLALCVRRPMPPKSGRPRPSSFNARPFDAFDNAYDGPRP